MRAFIVTLLFAAAAVNAAAPAWPSSFVSVAFYGFGACTGTPSIYTDYAVGQCMAGTSTSTMVSAVNSTAVSYNTYSGTACAGTATSMKTYVSGVCNAGSVYTIPSTDVVYAEYFFSDTACATLQTASYSKSGMCIAGGGGQGASQFKVSSDQKSLQSCTYTSTADCSAGETCQAVPLKQCVSGVGTGSFMFDTQYGAAFAAAAPAVTLTVAAIAMVVAAINKF